MQHLLNSTTNSTTGTGSAAARAGYLDSIVDASYSYSRHHHATSKIFYYDYLSHDAVIFELIIKTLPFSSGHAFDR